jgi:hypothetical protein
MWTLQKGLGWGMNPNLREWSVPGLSEHLMDCIVSCSTGRRLDRLLVEMSGNVRTNYPKPMQHLRGAWRNGGKSMELQPGHGIFFNMFCKEMLFITWWIRELFVFKQIKCLIIQMTLQHIIRNNKELCLKSEYGWYTYYTRMSKKILNQLKSP